MHYVVLYRGHSHWVVVACLFLQSLSMSFNSVIVDSIMVAQARQYPKEGSAELNSFS
jgi:hypothetical protein